MEQNMGDLYEGQVSKHGGLEGWGIMRSRCQSYNTKDDSKRCRDITFGHYEDGCEHGDVVWRCQKTGSLDFFAKKYPT